MGRKAKATATTTQANPDNTIDATETQGPFRVGDTTTAVLVIQNSMQPISTHQVVNAMATETRPRLQLKLDGIEVDFLYDTGASSTCITHKTYLQHFQHKPLSQLRAANGLCAAGNDSLNYLGSLNLRIEFNNRTVDQCVEVCQFINDNCCGINLIHDFKISFNADEDTLYAVNQVTSEPQENQLLLKELMTFPAHSVTITAMKTKPTSPAIMMATIRTPEVPTLVAGPALTRVDEQGRCLIAVSNMAPFSVTCARNSLLGAIEDVPDLSTPAPLSGPTICSIIRGTAAVNETVLDPEAIRNILQQQGTAEDQIEHLTSMLSQYQNILKDQIPQASATHTYQGEEPHFQKQPKTPNAHKAMMEQQIDAWIKQGLVRKADSMFNTPLVCIRNGSQWRIVQDFRELNKKLLKQSANFKDIDETIKQVQLNQSQAFSTLDLSTATWQLRLTEEQQPATAFSYPGKGQFQWTRAPLSLAGAEATFHRLLSTICEGLPNVIPHLDRIVVHSRTHEEQIPLLHQLFQRLSKHRLSINLSRSSFLTSTAAIMGFQLSNGHCEINPNQRSAILSWQEPTSTAMIKSFLGLTNFFRGHIKDYAAIAAPLNDLIKTTSSYRGGALPPAASTAFHRLINYLRSEPILTLPKANRQYAVIVDASTGTEDTNGGIGAILTQVDHRYLIY